MRVSLVMPTWNGGPLLDEVLQGLAAQEGLQFAEKVAIDSGSRDGTQDRLRAHGFQVTAIPQHEFDHGSTRDRGIALTSGEVVVLLTQDATPLGRDWLQRMVEPFADPTVAGVWCRQEPRPNCQPVLQRRIRGWPGRGTGVSVQRLQPGETMASLPPMERLLRCAIDNVAAAVRRSAWQRFPLGPRRFGEDVWFGYRVIEAGLAIAHQGGAAVMHSHDRTAFAEGRRTFCDHRNLRELFGLCGIPTLAALRAGIRDGTREHLAYLDSLGLPPAAAAAARQWTVDYVRWQCWGQYLGAKAGARPRGLAGVFFRWLGRRLERGIG